MSLEPSKPASDGKRPAFTGRFPLLAAESPSDHAAGERRPRFSAPASGTAESLAPTAASGGAGAANPSQAGDGIAGSEAGKGRSSAAGAPAGDAGGAADGPDRGSSPANESTAALRPGIKSATSGVLGTGAAGNSDTSVSAETTNGSDTPDAGLAAPAHLDGASDGSAVSAPSAAAGEDGLDGPLLGDTVGLRLNWERLQAGFVDDPEEAVSGAAELVEDTAQALVSALRKRQRTLRELAKRGAAEGEGGPGATDTEHLRRMMLRYRSLFYQLSRP